MGKKWLIVNTESLQAGKFPDEVLEYMRSHRDQFVIVDESSKFKTNVACTERKKSMRTQAIKAVGKLRGAHRCIMTGTFMSKSPVNAFDQMEILKENYFGCDMFAFQRRHVVMVRLPIGRGVTAKITEDLWKSVHKALKKAKEKGEWNYSDVRSKLNSRWSLSDDDLNHIEAHEEYTPFKRVDEIIQTIEKDCMIVRKEDCYDLPETVYKTVTVDMPKEMRDLYQSLLKNGFTDDIACTDTLSMYHRFLDICNGFIPKQDMEAEDAPVTLERQKESPKLSALLEQIEEIGVPEHKVIVWCNRTMLLDDAVAALQKEGYRVAKYDGNISDKEKKAVEDGFRNGEIDIFVGNQASGGYGLDFLKDCTYSIFISNDYSVETRHQAEKRAERGEFTAARTVIDIVVSGSVESKIIRALKQGNELLSKGRSCKALFDLVDESLLPVF